jgi:hypothetical protein
VRGFVLRQVPHGVATLSSRRAASCDTEGFDLSPRQVGYGLGEATLIRPVRRTIAVVGSTARLAENLAFRGGSSPGAIRGGRQMAADMRQIGEEVKSGSRSPAAFPS